MKERIVMDFGAELKNICNGCAEGVKAKCKQTQKDHLQCALQKSELEEFKVEKYPTSWEELKELCKGRDKIRIANVEGIESIILNDNLICCKYGTVFVEFSEHTYCFAKDRTIPQLWAFIKSLIGEE